MRNIKDKEELTAWALQAVRLWLFLDYDGTLADFAPTPDDIVPDPALIGLLEELSHIPDTRLTILSGRRLSHIRSLLPVPGLFLAGTYGIELAAPGSETVRRLDYDVVRPALETIKPRWEQILHGRSGFFLEDKGWALALHARFAADPEAEVVLRRVQQETNAALLTDHFRMLGGHKFLEIAPRLASKKETVAYLLEHYPLPEARLLYIGDDDKDEEAFPLIHAHGGVAVKVRQPAQASRPTEADFFFESTAETRRWLESLLEW